MSSHLFGASGTVAEPVVLQDNIAELEVELAARASKTPMPPQEGDAQPVRPLSQRVLTIPSADGDRAADEDCEILEFPPSEDERPSAGVVDTKITKAAAMIAQKLTQPGGSVAMEDAAVGNTAFS